ncbi:MAG TPA: PASTA domain-containing protein, partial [Acidimicrobiales bacterium]|nr:PASTA domain-containing protein [Acidimicrobiales bacterium]
GTGPSSPPGAEDTTDHAARAPGVAQREQVGGIPSHHGASPPWRTGRYPVPGEMSPNDRSAKRLMVGAVVVVLAVIVGLVGGWFYVQSQIPSYPVPGSLVGMQIDDVPAAVDDYEWQIDESATRRDGTQPGQVLETTPAAGEDLREGATLHVLVSEGATLVDVPTGLAGMSGDDAAAALEAAELAAELVERPSEDVPEGVVIGFVDGDPGAQLPKGSTVRLAVSSGDEFDLPDVRGKPYGEAVDQLEGMGLEVEVEDDRDRDVEPGHVIRTDPDDGDEVESGDTVTVVVAVEQVDIPTLRGRSLDEATDALEDVGLSVGDVMGPRDGVVLATWPLEGSEVSSGTPVSVVMR